MKLKDKVAVITGSGAGIGKAIATIFAQQGAQVVIADFNEDALTQTVSELTEQGYEALGVKVNVSEENDIQKLMETVVKHYQKVDILVNNAGVSDNMQAAGNVEDVVWERVLDINVTGVMRSTRAVLPIFIENGGGTIINIASISGLTGGRGGFGYTAAKHAVVGMTKNVASQYGPQNIRCNAIAPAHVDTGFAQTMTNVDQFGMKMAVRGANLMHQVGKIEDIGNIALFLASEDSKYINGVALACDGGWSAY